MGMHTGRPTLTDTGYVGIAVHIAARVCYASHGGQILLSSTARESFTERLAEGLSFRSLGRYSLHGLTEPEQLFQVNAADLRAKFPRPRTIGPLRSRAEVT
jgi:class 3 adenylate cyclase